MHTQTNQENEWEILSNKLIMTFMHMPEDAIGFHRTEESGLSKPGGRTVQESGNTSVPRQSKHSGAREGEGERERERER